MDMRNEIGNENKECVKTTTTRPTEQKTDQRCDHDRPCSDIDKHVKTNSKKI